MGTVDISSSTPSFKVDFSSAQKKFGEFVGNPVVMLTASSGEEQFSLVASLQSVDTTSFTVNVKAFPASAWTSKSKAYLNWFAVEGGEYNAEGVKKISAGLVDMPAGNAPYVCLSHHYHIFHIRYYNEYMIRD